MSVQDIASTIYTIQDNKFAPAPIKSTLPIRSSRGPRSCVESAAGVDPLSLLVALWCMAPQHVLDVSMSSACHVTFLGQIGNLALAQPTKPPVSGDFVG